MTFDTVAVAAPSSTSPTSSPLRSSPLANPPIYSARRDPSPSQARPIPRRTSQPTRSRPAIIAPITPTPSTSSSGSAMHVPTPSPPLSRSHPLLGSYPLSLIHSRMSHAHQPHSSSTTFSLHIKAVGQGKRCPPELRCPKPLDLPFVATYYDLENQARAGGSSQTPWVGTVDLEQHYYDRYASLTTITPEARGADPPDHPGYHVAPVGQLQMIVKTPSNAIKAFLVPYDLRELPVGGRLLARERTYVHSAVTPARSTPNSPDPASTSPESDKGKKKECLRYAYQLQFVCLSDTSHMLSKAAHGARESSTTRHTSSDAQTPGGKAYYLSKTLKVVFTSTPPEADEALRTERADEIVPPSSGGIRISNTVKQRRRSSGVFGPTSASPSGSASQRTLEEWELVRLKWMARRDMTEIHRSSASAADLETTHPHSPAIGGSGKDGTVGGNSAPALPPFKPPPPARAPTPIPQPFNLPRTAPPTKPPPSPRFQRRQLRRTSAEERELSEKLRNMGMGQGGGE